MASNTYESRTAKMLSIINNHSKRLLTIVHLKCTIQIICWLSLSFALDLLDSKMPCIFIARPGISSGLRLITILGAGRGLFLFRPLPNQVILTIKLLVGSVEGIP